MNRLWRLFRGNFHSDLQEEMQEHLREKIEELMDQGMSAPEARRAARRRFGNATFLAEQSRDEWTVKALADAWRDLRYAVRLMRRSPAFAVVAVVCLALGIGANAVIFAVVDHVLLRPLPYPSPERLVAVWTRNPGEGREHGASSAADFYDWSELSPFFESLSAYASWPVNLTNVPEPMRLDSDLVSPDFFRTLGVPAETGRTFAPDEDQPGKDSVVVISHRLWRQLGSPSQIVGRVLTLNRAPASVIGVMPASFQFLDRRTDLWMPLALSPQNRANREGRWLNVIARLAPRLSQSTAERDLAVVADRLATAFPATNKGVGVGLSPLLEEYVGQSRTTVLVLQTAVAFLLLITCANLANLLLARTAGRSREMALRAALGAGRGQIVRQLGIESGVLAALGGALGLALAHTGVRAVRTLGEGVIPRAAEIAMDGRVLLFTLLAAAATALLFGVLPAVHASRFDLRRHVYGGGRGTVRGADRQRNLLVCGEVAVACVLLVGASLLAESLVRLQSIEPGFQANHVLTMRITLPRSKYPDTRRQAAFFDEVLARVAGMPGILAAGEVSDAPLSRNLMSTKFLMEGSARPELLGIRFVTPGYLHAIGTPLQMGRDFTAGDTATSLPVALINRTAARRYWAGSDPVGKRLRLDEPERWLNVAGVVADTRHMGLADDEGPVVYIPYAQKTWDFLGWATLVVRTAGDPLASAASVRASILGIDPEQPVSDIASLEQSLWRSNASPRLTAWTVSAVSVLALLMAVVGVYGVLAYVFAQRVPEIGIRLALGASPKQLFWMLLRQGMGRVSAGIALGLAGSWILTRFLTKLLFGIRPDDPATFAGVAAVLAVAAMIAVLLPARRALRIDPARSLRADS